MSLSHEEIEAARKMFRFVRGIERFPSWVRFFPGLLLCLDGLVQISFGAHLSVWGRLYAANLIMGGSCIFCVQRYADFHYKQSVVMLKIFERDHPDEYRALQSEPRNPKGWLSLFFESL